MSESLPLVYIARHAETIWSLDGRQTGLTDLPLTERGEQNARLLGARLRAISFTKVISSPLQRAMRTCEIAGFGTVSEVDPDLVEWDYGQYEGRRSAEIRAERPDWDLFRDGCPGGETPQQISARADRVVNRVRSIDGAVLLFTSGHFSRVLAARWLGQQPWPLGRLLMLNTASLTRTGIRPRSVAARDSTLERNAPPWRLTLTPIRLHSATGCVRTPTRRSACHRSGAAERTGESARPSSLGTRFLPDRRP